jgi:GNAT superfamily N-acetyltransferase
MLIVSPFRLMPLPPQASGFSALLEESRRGGFRMLTRLEQEWQNGVNRFDRPGEILFGAFDGDHLVGVGGRNIDPFEEDPKIGRIRHVYVAENLRKLGIGRLLMKHILSDASLYFSRINVRAPTPAFGFYERLGFIRVDGIETITHHLALRTEKGGRVRPP